LDITQPEIDALEQWSISRRDAYFYKGMVLAAANGAEVLIKYRDASSLSPEDSAKSLSELKQEMLDADEFFKEARKILHGGRQGG
jgi:hypothetical protein